MNFNNLFNDNESTRGIFDQEPEKELSFSCVFNSDSEEKKKEEEMEEEKEEEEEVEEEREEERVSNESRSYSGRMATISPEFQVLLGHLPDRITASVKAGLLSNLKDKAVTKSLYRHIDEALGIYLPPYKSKRITYGYLTAVLSNKYLVIKKSSVKELDPSFISSRITKAELVWELQEIASLLKKDVGFQDPYPERKFLVNMLYTLKPDHRFFQSLQIVQAELEDDLDKALEQYPDEVPLPVSFRGLVRIDIKKFKQNLVRLAMGGQISFNEYKRRIALLCKDLDVFYKRARRIRKFVNDFEGITMEPWFEKLVKQKMIAPKRKRG